MKAKILLIMFAFIFSLSFASAYYECYQETANATSICTGFSTLNTGNYTYDNGWQYSGYVMPYRTFDTNWLTYARPDAAFPDSNSSNLNITYSNPSLAIGAFWAVKDAQGYFNVTIPEDCFNLTINHTLLKIDSHYNSGDYDDTYIYYYCFNHTSASYIKIVSRNNPSGFTRTIYEERIYWIFNTSFIEDNQSFNNISYGGKTESFILNITYNPGFYTGADAYLIYNGTRYSSVKYSYNNNATFIAQLTTPTNESQKNYSFYWEVALSNSSGVYYQNSSWNNQTIETLDIDDCSAYSNKILYYSLKDEVAQTALNGTIELSVQLYPEAYNISTINYSSKFISVTNVSICLNANFNDTNYFLYSQANYYSNGYVTKNNYVQRYLLTNSSSYQTINLFDLNATKATKFILVYKGSDFSAVENTLITIERQYVSEGTYKTVESELTDYLGETTAYFDLDQNPKYTIVVTKNGVLLSTFNEISVFCDSYTTQCKLSLDALSTSGTPVNLYTYNNLAFSHSFNSTTRIYLLSYSTLDGSSSTVSINITKFDGYMNQSLCSSQLISSSGLITCTIPNLDNITFITSIYKDGILIAYDTKTIAPASSSAIFAGNIVIMSIGLVLTFGLMFIPSAVGVVIGVIIASIITTGLFIINGNAFFGTTFLLLTIIGGLIIWRLRSGGSD